MSKEAEWLKFNVRNIISNLYQAEDHARYLIPGMRPEHFSCIIKHLLFVDGELGEAESHASVVNESLIPKIRTIRQRVQRLLDRLEEPISTEADVAQVLRELREIRKEMEKLFPTYDTEECEVCAPPSEGLVEALKEVRRHPSLAELELDYAEKVIKFICDKYGVEPPKLVIDDTCYRPDIGWYDPKAKEIHVCRSGVNAHVLLHELAHHMGIKDEHEAEAFAIREGVGLELPVTAKALNPPKAMRHSGERSMVSSRDLLVIFGSQHLMKGIELAAEQYTDKTKPLWQRPDFLVSLGFTIGGALGGMYLSEPYATPLALMAGYASTKFWDFALEYMKKEQAAQAALVKAPAPVRVQVAPAPVPAAPSGEIKIV